MDPRIETVQGCLIRRTGWIAAARICPVHHSTLELCIEVTGHGSWSAGHQFYFDNDENRIRWHCEECVGSWFENHFLYAGEEQDASPTELVRRLVLSCPRCNSRRVTHTCVPDCCESHRCIDCGAAFKAELRITSPGGKLLGARIRSVSSGLGTHAGPPAVRSGQKFDFRRCETDDAPLELAFFSDDPGEPADLLGWYCAVCDRTWGEENFRVRRREFGPDAVAGALCPGCHGRVVTLDSGNHCERCGARIEVSLTPATTKRAH